MLLAPFQAARSTPYEPVPMPQCPECATEHAGAGPCPLCGAEGTHECERCGEHFQQTDSCPACGTPRAPYQCDRHPEAEAVGRCVVCGTALCRECQHGDSRTHLCEAHGSVTVIQGWAQVYSTTREFDAQLLKDNLLAEGIDAQIFSQRDNMFSVDVGELSIVRLLVPAWEFEAAERMIREHTNDRGELTFACPSCGEAYDPGSDTCAGCGADLSATSID